MYTNTHPMPTRSPRIDWPSGFQRHWLNNSSAQTHLFNAMSFIFPQGERFFIDSAREVFKENQTRLSPELCTEVKAFISQEVAHANQHRKYNATLETMGYRNAVEEHLDKSQVWYKKHFSPLSRLALVCAYERHTAVLGDFILTNPSILKHTDSKMALLWGWHSAEEVEHKGVCFDLYQAAGGGWLRRSLTYIHASIEFLALFGYGYLSLLKSDGSLHPSKLKSTVTQFLRFFFGRPGLGWHLFKYGLSYLRPSFHPWKEDNRDILTQWLTAHKEDFKGV